MITIDFSTDYVPIFQEVYIQNHTRQISYLLEKSAIKYSLRILVHSGLRLLETLCLVGGLFARGEYLVRKLVGREIKISLKEEEKIPVPQTALPMLESEWEILFNKAAPRWPVRHCLHPGPLLPRNMSHHKIVPAERKTEWMNERRDGSNTLLYGSPNSGEIITDMCTALNTEEYY